MKLKFIFFPHLLIYFLSVLSLKLPASDIESIGPYGGWFKCIGISKSNPDILYSGTYYGGIFKSTNYGENWTYLGFRGEKIISSIAIDCKDPDCVYFSWYASNSNNSGMVKSPDGGLTWDEIYAPATVVGASSKIPGVVLIGNDNGLYKSTDAGNVFVEINYDFGFNTFSIIESDPVDSARVYVGTSDAIYKSDNLGDDWTKLRNTYNFSTYPAYVNAISISELNNEIILVATSHDGMLISSDGGINWDKKEFSQQVHGVFCDNSNEDVIYAAHLSGFEKSSNLGTSFQKLKEGRFKAVKNSNNNIYLIEENEGTILKSTDKGQTWTQAINGINNVSINALLITNKENDELLAIVNAGFNRTLLKYFECVWDTISLNTVGDKLFKNQSNQHIYMLGTGYFSKCTDDQYQTWQNDSGLPYCNPLDLSINNDTLYLACGTAFEGLDAGIYKSTDEGDTWFLASEGLPLVEKSPLDSSQLGPVDMYAICIDKNNPQDLYAGGYQDLYKSNNSGTSWSKICTFDGLLIHKILVDPDSSNIVYLIAGYSYYNLPNTLYKSTNYGETFTIINGGLEQVHYLFFDNNESILYVGGKGGVIRSFDKASTWESAGENWDDVVVSSIVQKNGDEYMYAGTEESGVFQLDLTPTAVEKNSTYKPAAFILEQNYPNPFNATTTIKYNLQKSNPVILKIFNLNGQEIATLVNRYQEAGEQEIKWQAEGLASGIYLYQLKTNHFVETKKLVLLK